MKGYSRLDTEGVLPVCIDTGSCLSRMTAGNAIVGIGLLITDDVPGSVPAFDTVPVP